MSELKNHSYPQNVNFGIKSNLQIYLRFFVYHSTHLFTILLFKAMFILNIKLICPLNH